MNNTDAITLDLSSLSEDTITLSGAYDNMYDTSTVSVGNLSNTVIGGGYTYPNTISAASGPYTISTAIASPWASTSAKINLDGEGADIEVNGWSLVKAVKQIEERLNILTPNAKLEAEWDELKTLGDQYRKLEQHIKDKQATWDKLKAMPLPIVD